MPDPVVTAAAGAKAAVVSDVTKTVTKELTFFETHPKAIAMGAGLAGLVVGFLVAHFL